MLPRSGKKCGGKTSEAAWLALARPVDNQWKCPHCGKVYKQWQGLARHLKPFTPSTPGEMEEAKKAVELRLEAAIARYQSANREAKDKVERDAQARWRKVVPKALKMCGYLFRIVHCEDLERLACLDWDQRVVFVRAPWTGRNGGQSREPGAWNDAAMEDSWRYTCQSLIEAVQVDVARWDGEEELARNQQGGWNDDSGDDDDEGWLSNSYSD